MGEITTDDALLMAVCGLYCGACYHYRAGQPDGAHLLEDAARGGRPLAGYTCGGCRSGQRYIHPGCAACQIRACAEAAGLRHCGECPSLPCDRLVAFQTDGRKHHLDVLDNLRALRAQGADAWLKAQAARWRCPGCGAPFSWYEQTCQACGCALPSYGEDVRVRPNTPQED